LRIQQAIFGAVNATVVAGLLLLAPASHATTHKKHKKTAVSTAKNASAKTTAAKSGSKKHLKRTRHSRNWKRHGQQAVDGRRTEQIQQALIQSHYLDGEPSGAWDAKTQEALRRYQAALGAITDGTVLLHELDGYSKLHPRSGARLARYRRRVERARRRLIERHLADLGRRARSSTSRRRSCP